MKEYLQIREKKRRTAIALGVVVTLFAHAGVLLVCSFHGLKYIWPPPAESTFLLDFTEEEDPVKLSKGFQPRSEETDREKPIELTQRSQSPNESSKPNLTPETKPDDFGDVPTPTPEPKEEPKLDARASFPGMAKKDTSLTAAHSAEKASNTFKAGQTDGNATKGPAEGKPNAQLKGRSTTGLIPRPVYNIQESGTVVVTVWVDNFGTVRKALPGAEGTTVDNPTLWAAARKAAMETHFNVEADAPALQEGTITYIFNLK